MKIFLIRHGESLGNTQNRLMGCRDESHLTDRGIESAEKLAKYFAGNENIDMIFSSPILRARQTAEIISQKIFQNSSQIIFEKNLQEIDWGDATGMKIDEIPPSWSEVYLTNPYFHKHPNGESFAELTIRANDIFSKIISQNFGKNIIIVSHAMLIAAIIAKLRNLTLEVFSLKIENTAIIEYEFDGENFVCKNFNKKI